jgi:hypothetical protein
MHKAAQGFSSRRTFGYAADAKPAENAVHRENDRLGNGNHNSLRRSI